MPYRQGTAYATIRKFFYVLDAVPCFPASLEAGKQAMPYRQGTASPFRAASLAQEKLSLAFFRSYLQKLNYPIGFFRPEPLDGFSCLVPLASKAAHALQAWAASLLPAKQGSRA